MRRPGVRPPLAAKLGVAQEHSHTQSPEGRLAARTDGPASRKHSVSQCAQLRHCVACAGDARPVHASSCGASMCSSAGWAECAVRCAQVWQPPQLALGKGRSEPPIPFVAGDPLVP